MGIVILVCAFFAIRYFTTNNRPSIIGIESKIKTYIESSDFGNCKGTNALTFLDNVSLGAYIKQFDAWPIYANYETKCKVGSNTTTYNGRNNAQKKVAMVFVKKGNSGNLDIFIPDIYNQAFNEMQQKIDETFGI